MGALPLPPGSLIVHPIHGRIARLLDSAQVLTPLLIDYLLDLQDAACIRTAKQSPLDGKVFPMEEMPIADAGRVLQQPRAWDWSDDNPSILVGKWEANGSMAFLWTSPYELRALCCPEPPRKGDWYCENCGQRNTTTTRSCGHCPSGSPPEHGIGQSWK